MRAAIERILDANLNRAREGLRVAEELARLVLENGRLQQALKAVRHSIARVEPGLPASGWLRHRATQQDPGATGRTFSSHDRKNFTDIARANLRRAEEALRVLEEISKLRPGPASGKYKRIRFRVYDLEQDLHQELQRYQSRRHVAR